ncbi:hypothetical protein IQ251_12700 [Saccharopolyspora sp. HNM0983]|uniref:Uncharacterized protein n=1 Tax=Saccharopolyspora montiporae TaxID=2781240 RepID=A0A929B8Q6_9PSEU|nr:hypothetical protein [Saccharopolyspora sp. HNM0983]MBE9375304.1 hypothetical protein [Saccharopolyspora sp. HNM0983]
MATVWTVLAAETVVALAMASAAAIWANKFQRKTVDQVVPDVVPVAGQTV